MEGDDWEDLFAVVRGSISHTKLTTTSSTSPSLARDPYTSLTPKQHHDINHYDHLLHLYFSDLDHFNTTTNSNNTSPPPQELEDLCKPFLRPQPAHNQFHNIIKPFSSTAPLPFITRHSDSKLLPQSSRSKRRKNQQKRVVCHVPADALSSDMWAWRKYGQKPIKGSPFPRGYYRCSSSKGCLARKQVERSRKDPEMYIITYTAEHNHPIPTHRNSLAGSTRQKSTNSISVSKFLKQKKETESSGSEVTEEEVKKEEEEEEEGEEQVEEDEEGMVMVREMEMEMLGDEMLFVGFDEFDNDDGLAMRSGGYDNDDGVDGAHDVGGLKEI